MNNFLIKLRQGISNFNIRFAHFMEGRNGMDQLAKAESALLWVVIILSLLLSWVPYLSIGLSVIFGILIIHMYFRVFSKDISKRYTENQKYLYYRSKFQNYRERQKRESAQKDTYRFFRCPNCRQRVRVPKGRGKIQITCPKCRIEFVKRS